MLKVIFVFLVNNVLITVHYVMAGILMSVSVINVNLDTYLITLIKVVLLVIHAIITAKYVQVSILKIVYVLNVYLVTFLTQIILVFLVKNVLQIAHNVVVKIQTIVNVNNVKMIIY